MTNNLTRRLWRIVAVLMALTFVAASCGSDDETAESETTGDAASSQDSADEPAASGAVDDEASSGEQVTLRFSWWGGDSRHEYTQQLVELFEAENPNIDIEPTFTDWGSYWDQLATTTAAGDTPDIMQHEIRYIREYSDQGVLADLNPYLGSTIATADLDSEALAAGAVGDATYAIPTGVNALSLVVDPVAFETYGIDLPDDTSLTWDEFNALAASITEASGGDVYGTQDIGNNEAHLQVFLRQNGEDLYNEAGTDLGFSPETMAAWWNTLIDQRGAGAPTASVTVEVTAGGLDQSLLSTNRGAMGFWWSNQLGALTEGSGRDLQLLRIPGGSEGMFLKPAMFWAMSAKSEHPEEAAKFIDFMVNSEAAASIMLTDRGLPVNLALRETIAGDLDPANQQAADFVSTVGGEAKPPPGAPPQGAGDIQAILQRIHEEVLFEQRSVDEAVEAFMSEARVAIGAA
jgi:multiple sugar transport system substrate-binding protein